MKPKTIAIAYLLRQVKRGEPIDGSTPVVVVINTRGRDAAYAVESAAFERGAFALRLAGDPQLNPPEGLGNEHKRN